MVHQGYEIAVKGKSLSEERFKSKHLFEAQDVAGVLVINGVNWVHLLVSSLGLLVEEVPPWGGLPAEGAVDQKTPLALGHERQTGLF